MLSVFLNHSPHFKLRCWFIYLAGIGCAAMHMWKSERRRLAGIGLSFHHLSSRNQTQHLHQLSHPADPLQLSLNPEHICLASWLAHKLQGSVCLCPQSTVSGRSYSHTELAWVVGPPACVQTHHQPRHRLCPVSNISSPWSVSFGAHLVHTPSPRRGPECDKR